MPFYCFVEEDLDLAPPTDPLRIQAEYAKTLGQFCQCSLTKRRILDSKGNRLSPFNIKLFLRTTYDSLQPAISLCTEQGFDLLETARAVDVIERWYELQLAGRPILSFTIGDYLSSSLPQSVYHFLNSQGTVFLKTKRKGFSCLVKSSSLLHFDDALISILHKYCCTDAEIMLLTAAIQIKTDYLGKKESRHFVMNGRIVNSSRTVYGIQHTVPRSLLEYATSIVSKIGNNVFFPKNYVLDLALIKEDSSFVDIIEINPITCSLCYAGNSIFTSNGLFQMEDYTPGSLAPEFQHDKYR